MHAEREVPPPPGAGMKGTPSGHSFDQRCALQARGQPYHQQGAAAAKKGASRHGIRTCWPWLPRVCCSIISASRNMPSER